MANSENGGSNKQASGNNVQEEANIYEDEIDLREYIQVIIKRRKLIIRIFLIAVVAAAIYSLCLPKVYEATASVMIMPSRMQSALTPARIFLDLEKTPRGEYIGQRPAISIPTHKALLKSNAVLERVMNKLKLTGTSEEEVAFESLFGKLEIVEKKKKEETNILQLVVQDSEPGKAKEIVNTWANEYAQYSLEIITGEVKGSGDFVVKQFELAEESLVKTEEAAKDFDVKERLSLMAIELKENRSQLESHYAKVHKLNFALKEKKKVLQKEDDDVAAMTRNGIWLGCFSVKGLDEKRFADETLSPNQKALRQKTLKAKLGLEVSKEKRDSFVNDSGVYLLKDELARKKNDFLSDKLLLARVKQLGESTKVNLKSNGRLGKLENFKGPIAENLSDLTIWEILSLTQGYNFFETRRQSLASKIGQQATELKNLEKVLFEYNDKLKTLDETFNRAQTSYDFYLGKFKGLESKKNSVELEIADIEFELSYSKDLVKKLENDVKVLKVAINQKKAKQVELSRQLDICKKAYTTLASKIEEARIAKVMELGEVKVVSMAFEPQRPVAPKKKRIVVLAGVASLMLGVFLAFFMEFWQKSEDTKISQAQTS